MAQDESFLILSIYALEENLFMLEGLDFFRIKFEKDKVGKVTRLVGLYDDGTISISDKD